MCISNKSLRVLLLLIGELTLRAFAQLNERHIQVGSQRVGHDRVTLQQVKTNLQVNTAWYFLKKVSDVRRSVASDSGTEEPARLLCPWDSPSKNTGVCCHGLLQGISPTQGSNSGLPHWRQTLYYLTVFILFCVFCFSPVAKHQIRVQKLL